MESDWEAKAQEEVSELGRDIIASDRFSKANEVPHHYGHSIAEHSLRCARYAVRISDWLERHGVHLSKQDAVRACLLHDMGMTVDDVFESPSRVKAHTHPVEGARIAREEFDAEDETVDAIEHHMWPICPTAPRHVLGWVVTAADKCSSVRETQDYIGTVAKTLKGEGDG